MTHKSLLFTTIILLLGIGVLAGEPQWQTDFEKAKMQAKSEKRLILMNFTGSDFCTGCMALRKNVFSTPEFAKFAASHLVLVELDFPESKPQSESLKRNNEELREMYKVEGFPTVIVLDAKGREVKRELGYPGTKAKDYIASLTKLKNSR